LFAEPVGDLVGVDLDVLGEVDHRLDGDVGVGAGAPGADLLGGEALAGVLQPRQVERSAASGDRGLGEVDVEHDLARPAASRDPWLEVECQLAAGEVAGGDRAAYVERLVGSGDLELLGTSREGGVEVEGVGQVELGLWALGALGDHREEARSAAI